MRRVFWRRAPERAPRIAIGLVYRDRLYLWFFTGLVYRQDFRPGEGREGATDYGAVPEPGRNIYGFLSMAFDVACSACSARRVDAACSASALALSVSCQRWAFSNTVAMIAPLLFMLDLHDEDDAHLSGADALADSLCRFDH